MNALKIHKNWQSFACLENYHFLLRWYLTKLWNMFYTINNFVLSWICLIFNDGRFSIFIAIFFCKFSIENMEFSKLRKDIAEQRLNVWRFISPNVEPSTTFMWSHGKVFTIAFTYSSFDLQISTWAPRIKWHTRVDFELKSESWFIHSSLRYDQKMESRVTTTKC